MTVKLRCQCGQPCETFVEVALETEQAIKCRKPRVFVIIDACPNGKQVKDRVVAKRKGYQLVREKT